MWLMNKLVLIVEDDVKLQKYLKDLLTAEGFLTQTLNDGIDVLDVVEKTSPDIVILDLELPTIKGESVCKQVKNLYSELPIIVLTGKSEIEAKRALFESGADDYMTKPFEAEELILRIKARIKSTAAGSELLKAADLEMNTNTMEVKRSNNKIDLTPQEYKLLNYLLLNKEKVLSREVLLNKIWDNAFDIETRVVDVYISYLRKKIDEEYDPKLIHSVRGFGYILKDQK